MPERSFEFRQSKAPKNIKIIAHIFCDMMFSNDLVPFNIVREYFCDYTGDDLKRSAWMCVCVRAHPCVCVRAHVSCACQVLQENILAHTCSICFIALPLQCPYLWRCNQAHKVYLIYAGQRPQIGMFEPSQ